MNEAVVLELKKNTIISYSGKTYIWIDTFSIYLHYDVEENLKK
jgi:hypothetical protein